MQQHHGRELEVEGAGGTECSKLLAAKRQKVISALCIWQSPNPSQDKELKSFSWSNGS